MMNLKRLFLILATAAFVAVSCDPYKIEIPNQGNNNNTGTNNGGGNNGGDNGDGGNEAPTSVTYPTPGVAKTKTLLTSGTFTERQLQKGITYYTFNGKDEITGVWQNVNVVELDLNNEAYKVEFLMSGSTNTQHAGKNNNAIVCMNAAYEQDAIYNRTKGKNHSEVTLASDHLRFWKHEAAIVGDGERKVGIIHGAKGHSTANKVGIQSGGKQAIEIYKSLSEPNIFASSPMLIDDFNPVGTTFVPEPYNSMTLSQLKSAGLNSEDYRYHQAYRHPRTAMALTEDNDLLFITVDGRFSGKAEGMSAKELTLFIKKHFNPRWAINMDGGGSTSMYIKGYSSPCGVDGIVNHPCNDNSTWSQANLRSLNTYFLIKYNE